MPVLGLHPSEVALVRIMSRYSATSFSSVGNSPDQKEELIICIAVLDTYRYVQGCMVYTYVLEYAICNVVCCEGRTL